MTFRVPRLISTFSLAMLLVLLGTFAPSRSVYAYASTPAIPVLSQFITQLRDGRARDLRGVYVPNVLAAPIVQQPVGQYGFVSSRRGVLTQFSLPAKFETTGLLAHNYLAGARFALMNRGQILYLVYGDGRVARFVIREIQEYQALNPLSETSSFENSESGAVFTARELLERIYNQPGKLVFQTCIARGTELAWGRLFIIAEELPAQTR